MGDSGSDDVAKFLEAMGIDLDEEDEVIDSEAELDSILLEEDGTISWDINTGMSTPGGAAKRIKVKVMDPQDSTLLSKFFDATSEAKGDSAIKMVWDACIVSPKGMTSDERFPRLPTMFKEGLTQRLLRLIGLEAFMDAILENKAELRAAVRKSSSESRATSGSDQPKSETSGAQVKSRGVVTMPSSSESKSDSSSWRTSVS